MPKKLITFLALVILTSVTYAADLDTVYFRNQEQLLIKQYRLISMKTGSEKKTCELEFRDSLASVLKQQGAPNFSFDSLKFIGRIVSDDNRIIVYTWNIPQTGGFHNYYCLIHYYNKKEKSHTLTALNEKTGFLNTNQQMMADINNWPGALYYKIINTKGKGQYFYTLIGYDFNDLISNRKVIEMVYFNDKGKPVFAQQGFTLGRKRQNRIVFEYAERAQMAINYDEKNKMIIYDHLSPFKPSLQNQYQFYGPDLSYDGLVFKDGIWTHESDVTPEF